MCSGILLEKRQIMPEVSFHFLRELLLKSLVVSLSYQNILCMKSKRTHQPTKKLLFNRRSNQPFNWHTPSVEQKNSNSYFVKSSLFFWTMNENYLLDVWSDGRGGNGLAGVGHWCWMAWNTHTQPSIRMYILFSLCLPTHLSIHLFIWFSGFQACLRCYFFSFLFSLILWEFTRREDNVCLWVCVCIVVVFWAVSFMFTIISFLCDPTATTTTVENIISISQRKCKNKRHNHINIHGIWVW